VAAAQEGNTTPHPEHWQLLVRDRSQCVSVFAQGSWQCRKLYAQLNFSDPDVEVMKHTQAKFRAAVRTFANNSMPHCACWMNRSYVYDHSWLDHIVNQTKS
jgi:hypothetical protein